MGSYGHFLQSAHSRTEDAGKPRAMRALGMQRPTGECSGSWPAHVVNGPLLGAVPRSLHRPAAASTVIFVPPVHLGCIICCCFTALSVSCLVIAHLTVPASNNCRRLYGSKYKGAHYMPVSAPSEGEGAPRLAYGMTSHTVTTFNWPL